VSSSLREQLLKAGLVTETQVRETEGKRRPPPLPKKERGRPTSQELASQRAHAAKASRDQALSRERAAAAQNKAKLAQIAQLIEEHRLPKVESDGDYQFTEGQYIRRVPVNAVIRAQLGHGELAIVRHQGRYELIPAAIAARIRERDAGVILYQALPQASPEPSRPDEAYQAYVVPDDLIW
jgi:uncharacterized protein